MQSVDFSTEQKINSVYLFNSVGNIDDESRRVRAVEHCIIMKPVVDNVLGTDDVGPMNITQIERPHVSYGTGPH